jgi:multidrug efflux pump subunit AcrB
MAMAQVTGLSETLVRILPPGIGPPSILKYDASTVPILQLGLGGDALSESQLYDLGNNFIRQDLSVVKGISVLNPVGGKQRQIMVDLNPRELMAKQLTAQDVSNSLGLQNLIVPAGTAKLADTEYQIRLNSSPTTIAGLNNLPLKNVNGATVYMKDVANVRDGYSVQNNIVRTNGTRGALITIMRNGQASTLDVVEGVKKELPKILAGLPKELKVSEMFDQSIFVKSSVTGVVREATIAAALTGMMILLFLGSWRSTLIVCVSIPLSILASLTILGFMGETVNVMTLGGLALAVGILVDDATVEIENIHRNLAMGKGLATAILDGAQQIAVPAFVSTLAICIVFVPVLLLTGTARFLFTPLALAVVFAMGASYLLSRTLVPTMVHFLLGDEAEMYRGGEHATGGTGIIWAAHHVFNRAFEKMRSMYSGFLDWALDHAVTVIVVFAVATGASLCLTAMIGRDFFPKVDAGMLRLHARAPVGSRIEETEARYQAIEEEIRKIVPAQELDSIIDDIGLPNGGWNLALTDTSTIDSGDGEILISLKKGHEPTVLYERRLRKELARKFPDMGFFFQAADITGQILNFGLPAPLDLQVFGRSPENYKIAQQMAEKIACIPGATDVHVHQIVNYPVIQLDVDRTKAMELGMTQRDVSNSMLISLSASSQISPQHWVNWQNGVNYNLSVQTPQYDINSLAALLRTPVGSMGAAVATNTAGSLAGTANEMNNSVGTSPGGATAAYGNPGSVVGGTQLLSNLVDVKRGLAPALVSHYNATPVFDVYANIDRRDLGGVGGDIQKLMAEEKSKLPPATQLILRGQFDTMQSSFFRLGLGMIAAVILVYLLMVVNFQSWLDPFIILTALPGAMAGIVWILFVTQTTFNVPSLMGAIMCVGVATANSILLVVFANDLRREGAGPRQAALQAGITRIRPVLMTAAAMILGMLPMALGLGEGGEQNAPLGRAVIGGLMFATVTTLVIVPVIYSLLRKKPPIDHARRISEEQAAGRHLGFDPTS